MTQEVQNFINSLYEDINEFVDCHTHILGFKECKNGNFINPKMQSFLHPFQYMKFLVYKNAANIKSVKNGDTEYIEHLKKLILNINQKSKYYILALDKFYNKNGVANFAKTEFYTSNEYVFTLSQNNPNIFIPVISIHPYRNDAIEKLVYWGEKGVKYIKWLPNAMGFSPDDKNIIPFYEEMIKQKMTLLSHTGYEEAVKAKDFQECGNPLLLRTPLDLGVKVIAAHCASYGTAIDLDSTNKKKVQAFDLFLRLMDNKKYENLLYGDISAITLVNRNPKVLKTLLERTDLHHRLINGSDYPLPSINIVIQTKTLLKNGFITKNERKILNELFTINPLLFDYAVKRTIKHPVSKSKFKSIVFEKKLS